MLSVPEDDGVPLREYLTGLVERSINSGKPESHRAAWEAELAGQPFPAELLYLWKIYNRLRGRQGSSGFGPLPVSWSAIDAFVSNARWPLAPWEVETIEHLDNLYLATQAKARRKPS